METLFNRIEDINLLYENFMRISRSEVEFVKLGQSSNNIDIFTYLIDKFLNKNLILEGTPIYALKYGSKIDKNWRANIGSIENSLWSRYEEMKGFSEKLEGTLYSKYFAAKESIY